MHIGIKNIAFSRDAKFLARKLFRLLAVILLFYSIYIFSKKQNEFSELLTKTDNRLVRLYGKIKQNTCKNVVINGVKYSDYRNIQNHINKYCSDKYENAKNLKNTIKNDVWVKDVKVAVKLPDKIIIEVEEYNPFALITDNGSTYKLIDGSGNLININQTEIGMFEYLLKIVGFDVKDYEISDLFNMLSIHHNVAKDVISVVRVGNRRWNLVLSGYIIVKMPEEDDNTFKAWNILSNILAIKEILLDLKEIDLRDKDKIYLKYNSKILQEIIELQ